MDQDRLIPQKGVEEFFFHQVRSAINNQNLSTHPHTEFYLVRLLSNFCQSDRLFPDEESKVTPLAIRYLQSLQLDRLDSVRLLQELGDFTLYTTGFFQESLQRSHMDLSYYFSLGGNAYHRLHSLGERSQMLEVFQETFLDLASRFPAYVEVLSEISENTLARRDTDLLKLYERWLATGSRRLLKKLQEAGIHPLPIHESQH
jgi:hypothetical protein